MNHFTIENETNNITVYPTREAAYAAPESEDFSTEAELATLAANWPTARLAEIFNSLPGVTPVKKFTDRKTAVSRIWRALQTFAGDVPAAGEAEIGVAAESLPPTEESPKASEPVPAEAEVPETPFDAPVSAQTPDVAPEATQSGQKATRPKKAPQGAKPREASKTSRVIAMLKREGGTTLEDIMSEMGWQAHTTRAMLSAGGSLTKNHGLVITSEKVGDKRTYFIKP